MVHLHGMQRQANNIMLSKNGCEELDEFTFIEWKNELEPNLHDFWSVMIS